MTYTIFAMLFNKI